MRFPVVLDGAVAPSLVRVITFRSGEPPEWHGSSGPIHPVRLRINGKKVATEGVQVYLKPVISRGESVGFYKVPDRVVGMEILVLGVLPENGRLEFWSKSPDDSIFPFIYWMQPDVEWRGSMGTGGAGGGWMYVPNLRQGLGEFRKIVREFKKATE